MNKKYTTINQLNNDKINLLFPLNKETIQNSFELSSEDDLQTNMIVLKKDNELNLNNTIKNLDNKETDLKTKIRYDNNNQSISFNNDYKISNFYFSINRALIYINQNKKYISNKKRGRKRKIENNQNEIINQKIHNKFSDDNIRKKCKNIVLKYALESINEKIKEKYNNNIGHGNFKKELKILNQSNKVKSTVNVDKSLLNKTLWEIFSDDISNRFYNYPKNHNKIIIESLINEEDKEKRKYFNNLFNITFLQLLNYFIGIETYNELIGFKNFSSIKDSLIKNQGEEYVNMMIFYLQNFKELINQKRPRKTIKESKEKENE